MSKLSIKIHIEYGDQKMDFEGEVDEAIKAIIQFLVKVYPAYHIVSKFTFAPDVLKLMEDVSEFVKVSPEGQLMVVRRDLPTDEAISMVMLAAYVATKMGRMDNEEVPLEDLAKITGKALKTIQNTVPEMVKENIIEKTGKGAYKITPSGIMEVSQAIKSLREAEGESQGGTVVE